MGNATVFAKAFRENGIGGKHSKYHLVQTGDWFELISAWSSESSRYCYRTYDRFDNRGYRQLDSFEANLLRPEDPQWGHYLQIAVHAMKRIIARGNEDSPTRYYLDEFNRSVILVNRMFVIELTPTLRQVPEVTTNGIFDYLDSYAKNRVTSDCVVKAYSSFDNVVVCHNDHLFETLLTHDEFNELYGVTDAA